MNEGQLPFAEGVLSFPMALEWQATGPFDSPSHVVNGGYTSYKRRVARSGGGSRAQLLSTHGICRSFCGLGDVGL